MHRTGTFGLALVLLAVSSQAALATGWRKDSSELKALNKRIAGEVVDHTANHGCDNRMWSQFLYQRRDLYVYLPPNFQKCERYPLIIWMHGLFQDERSFLRDVVPALDRAIQEGCMPPVIVAAPDGTVKGEDGPHSVGGFWVNSTAGDFEDLITQDLWLFLTRHYPIHEDRKARAFAGYSMGGFGAYYLGIRYRNCVGIAAGISPPLNPRWADKHGNPFANFDPKEWGWRTEFMPHQKVGRLVHGAPPLRMKHVLDPLFGSGPAAVQAISEVNPIEMIDRYGVGPCELDMYVAYGKRDPFNIDAEVESFVYLARDRGLTVTVDCDPKGKHSVHEMRDFVPCLLRWLAPRLAPYSPRAVRCDDACVPTASLPATALPAAASPVTLPRASESAETVRDPLLRPGRW
jgi:S-formylglutathione hydrolase FrmB